MSQPWLGPTVEEFPRPELSSKPGPWANISFNDDSITITVAPEDRAKLAHSLLRLACSLSWTPVPFIIERTPNNG